MLNLGSLNRGFKHERIARAASSFRIAFENSKSDQGMNIAGRRVLRRLRQSCPFRRSQLTLKALEQTVEDKSLAFIEGNIRK